MTWCLALKACPLRNLLVRRIANQFCCRAVVTSGWPLAAGRKTSFGPRRASGWRNVINRPLAEQQAADTPNQKLKPRAQFLLPRCRRTDQTAFTLRNDFQNISPHRLHSRTSGLPSFQVEEQ